MGAICHFVPRVASTLHVEALAFRTALDLAIKQQWSGIVVEIDCALLIRAMERTGEDFYEVGRILEDCRVYFLLIHSNVFHHIYHETNGIAQRLAHLANFHYQNFICLNETPVIIQDAPFKKQCT